MEAIAVVKGSGLMGSPVAERNVQRRRLLRPRAVEAVRHSIGGAGGYVAQPQPGGHRAPVPALRPVTPCDCTFDTSLRVGILTTTR